MRDPTETHALGITNGASLSMWDLVGNKMKEQPFRHRLSQIIPPLCFHSFSCSHPRAASTAARSTSEVSANVRMSRRPREAQARKLGAGDLYWHGNKLFAVARSILGAKGKRNLGWCSCLTKQSQYLTCFCTEAQVNQGQVIKIYILSVLWAARSY